MVPNIRTIEWLNLKPVLKIIFKTITVQLNLRLKNVFKHLSLKI